jgi:cellulose synthase/poly-beta-1,6-N-acetylglucosamine synthase-like glycosyltransferase/spore germination protein YaaH/peptidoglycan/xylan/chitin deacetylase (PgdA/CDA1 family)
MHGKQIFQTSSATRWHRFKWSSRVFFLLTAIAVLAIVIWFFTEKLPNLPQLSSYKQALSGQQNFLSKNSLLAKKYKGFRQYINQKEVTNKAPYKTKVPAGYRNISNTNMPCGIRSAFYVTWNKQSLVSLQRNIQKLNLVIPEWMFIDPTADTVFTSIDAEGFAVMKNAGVNIMPMLSNFYNKDKNFHGESVHRIIINKSKRERLINDIINILQKNKFAGINVDLEELKETSDEAFVAFQKELYEKLHTNHFLVTQDVIPFNEDYNYDALAKYNDFLFVMAYDEYSSGTKAGPIAEQKWIEAAVDEATKKIPASKVVLGLAAFGYDWPKDNNPDPNDVTVLTYQDALTTAKEAQAKIDFDDDTYNLNFSYYDDDNIEHQAYFTDAATTFNAMRFATESSLAGVALWRLGSEDDRIWNFYNKNLSEDSARHFDFSSFAHIQSPDNVTYSGFGEVLDVLAMPRKGNLNTEIDSADLLISEENYDSLPSSFMAKKYGWNGSDTIRNKKKLVLTFDDGPDPEWTPKVLDILAQKHVPASFFVVGLNAENNIPLIKRIYREGHEIGDHTFTHPNIAEVSHRRAVIEMESTRLLIECLTGHSTVLFRAPYNADFTPEKMEELIPVAIARTKNYLDVGESIDPLDWEPGVNADTIVQRTIQRKKELDLDGGKTTGGNIILLHDAGGETRKATLEALPKIIDYFQKRSYTFTTIADLLGKKKEELMPPVPKGSGYYLLQANYIFLEITYWIGRILFSLFITFIVLSLARILLMAFLALKERAHERKAAAMPPVTFFPFVSIIVPAYNEEVNIISSLQNLLKTDYPNFDIIFVDDGSKDDTYAKVVDVFAGHQKIKAFTKPNGGKASALNFGIAQSTADYVVCIDADTKLKHDAVRQLMKHFTLILSTSGEGAVNTQPLAHPDLPSGKATNTQTLLVDDAAINSKSSKSEASEQVTFPLGRPGGAGAVAGNVKVGNEVNMLTKWQAIEYISSQNFDRRAFASVNAITVVPGAIGAFRKKAIEDAGGFTTDTLAEDCDLTIRILRAGYTIKNENNAIAYTEAPEKTKQFLKQRFRWSFGVLQTFWKHKDLLFNTKYKWLGCLAMPNILLFQYIIPAFIPFADLFMAVGLLTGNASKIIPYYFVFMLFDAGVAIIAFRMEKERLSRLVWLIPQRLIYRWLMWWVLFKSLRRAIKGELQSWGVLKRTGSVKEVEVA